MLGLRDANDLPDWDVTYAKAARTPDVPLPTDIGPDIMVKVRPRYDGVAIRGQKLTLFFQDGVLVSTAGVIRGRAEIAGSFSKMQSKLQRVRARTAVATQCSGPVTFEDPEPVADIARLEITQLYKCDDQVYRAQFDGLPDRAIPSLRSEYSPYVTPGVDVRAEQGPPTGQKWNWIPVGGFLNSATQIKNGMITDRQNADPNYWNCHFRMSYAGPDSAFPFPKTEYAGQHEERSWASCTYGGAAFKAQPSTTDFDTQVVHHQLSTFARYAAWQYNFRLYNWWPADDPDKLTADVKRQVGFCNGGFWPVILQRAAFYDQVDEDICISSAESQVQSTAAHEYGHYISDTYHFNAGVSPSCEKEAVHEGYADAMVLWFEQWRNSVQYFDDINLNRTYYEGAAASNGACRINGCPQVLVATSGLQTSALDVDATCGDKYESGKVLSQVLFPFLLNRVCDALDCTVASNIAKLLLNQPPPVYQLTLQDIADIGRQSFQFAMMTSQTAATSWN